MNIKKVILFLFLVAILRTNLILQTTLSTYSVSESSTLSVKIKTNAFSTITSLQVSLSDQFTVDANPTCQVNGTSTPCAASSASGSKTNIAFTSFTFSPNTNYTLTITVTNPPFSQNFQIDAYSSGTAFLNFGTVEIVPKSITCSIVSNSSVVGQISSITLSIGVQSSPIGSTGQIFLRVAEQSIFSNVINANPICTIDDTQYVCTQSDIFGEQVLALNDVPVGKKADSSPLSVNIRTMNNPPFNATFETITVQIQDSSNRDVEVCEVVQPQPSVLQESSSISVQNWQSLVGQTSQAQILLTPYFTPLSDLLVLLVFPADMTISLKAPITSTQQVLGDNKQITAGNITQVNGVLNIQCTIVNPSSTIPLSLTTYILYNITHFREQKTLTPTLVLGTQTITGLSAVAGIAQTLTQTTLTISLTPPISIIQATKITVSIDFGEVDCTNLNVLSNISTISQFSCAASELVLQVDAGILVGSSSYWVSFAYITHISTQTNNIDTVISSLQEYGIMQGSTTVSVSEGTSSFTITNLNTVYTQMTNFTISQQNTTAISTSILRIVQISLPQYVSLTSTASVASNNAQCVIVATQIDQGSNKVILRVQGRVDVTLVNIQNPTHYLGSRVWSLTLTDVSLNPSSSSSSTHTPQYSPTQTGLSISQQSQTTIQQQNNITISIQPQLQYDLLDPPTLTIQFSDSSIKNIDDDVCPNCQLLTSTKLSLPYYAVFMEITVLVQNNDNPDDNQISSTISLNSFTYEISQISYTLTPITYDSVVTFSGFYGQLGTLTVNLTTVLGQTVDLTYTGTQNVFQSDEQCLNCNSTFLTINGIVEYFTSTSIVVEGRVGGVLYASGIVTVEYTCFSISGCQICQSTNATYTCTKCFAQTLTNFYLLYQDTCWSTCPASSYADGVICQSCQQLCYICNADECLQCQNPYSLYLQSCVLECPPSYIKNATHCLPRPIVCPQNCVDCPADNQCDRCDASFYLLDDLCYTECPTGYLIADNNYECQLFIPPEETDYFPFVFVIISILTFAILSIIKCFQKRSLVLGNFIAFVSLFEIGTIIMVLSYTFSSIFDEPDRWTNDMILLNQALIFVILVSKVALNIIFLVYFLRNIATQENFENWLAKAQNNNTLYKTMLVLSSIFSFQIIRIIYCRLLGLELFFGRFKTALIFKPVNYFSLAYIIPAGCLIVMAVNNIIMQDGYRTSIFYSSIQMIIIEAIILIACLIQSRRADQQYFDYQIYKVQNLQEEATGSKINITYQKETGGSMHQVLNSGYKVRGNQEIQEEEDYQGHPADWRMKTYQPSISEDEQNESNVVDVEDPDHKNKKKKAKFNSMNEPSIFRKKILRQWQKLQEKMPNSSTHVFRKPTNQRISISPVHPKRSKKLAKTGSLQKIQIKSPHLDFKNKSLLKKYFHQINEREGEEQSINLDSKQGMNSQIGTFADNLNKDNEDYSIIGRKINGERGDVSEIKNAGSQQSFQRSLLEIGSNMKLNRYADFQKQEQENGDREGLDMNDLPTQSNNLKKRKNKKRNVNRQTEAVYLQRLASSEAHRKNLNCHKKQLDDF